MYFTNVTFTLQIYNLLYKYKNYFTNKKLLYKYKIYFTNIKFTFLNFNFCKSISAQMTMLCAEDFVFFYSSWNWQFLVFHIWSIRSFLWLFVFSLSSLSSSLSLSLSLSFSFCPFAFLSFCLFVSKFFCLFVFLSFCFFVFLYFCI